MGCASVPPIRLCSQAATDVTACLEMRNLRRRDNSCLRQIREFGHLGRAGGRWLGGRFLNMDDGQTHRPQCPFT